MLNNDEQLQKDLSNEENYTTRDICQKPIQE
jgi:hypothetical protein